jgi:Zn finger protein HypA/HybF involved in hydrogenase expression
MNKFECNNCEKYFEEEYTKRNGDYGCPHCFSDNYEEIKEEN